MPAIGIKILAPFTIALLCGIYLPSAALALEDKPKEKKATAPDTKLPDKELLQKFRYSSTVTGIIGLNNVPSARMDPSGTIKVGVSHLDPYYHSFLGFQIADPIFVSLRQSAESPKIDDIENIPYPGMDLKFRLIEENRSRPEIAIGMQSAIGHKRTAGEYIALSKRYRDFDFTFGMGWGRFGSAGHFSNPLKDVHSHFAKDRALDGDTPNKPSDWFTGEDVGFFGGVEYFTPVKGLSLKLDYSADDYVAAHENSNFNVPSPWSIGLSYNPTPWINISGGVQGNDKLMGRVTLRGAPASWPYGNNVASRITTLEKERKSQNTDIPAMAKSARGEEIFMRPAIGREKTIQADLEIHPHKTTPHHIGRAVIYMANYSGLSVETYALTPTYYGLHGPKIELLRRDFEQALIAEQVSPQEIWHNAVFKPAAIHHEKTISPVRKKTPYAFNAYMDDTLSLTDEDNGFFYRASLILEARTSTLAAFLSEHLSGGAGWRFNLMDNLENVDMVRIRENERVRSDLAFFAQNDTALDRAWLSYNRNITNDIYMGLTGGYLEEQYGGFGGEILYRPFGKRFAVGAEAWKAYKRDPHSKYTLQFSGDNMFTTHANLWYEIPKWDVTFNAKVGRYLGEDFGATAKLEREFDNGIKLSAFTTLTDKTDYSLLGGDTNAYHGISLSVPIWQASYGRHSITNRSHFTPLARDNGQTLALPQNLYDITTPFSKAHLARFWNNIIE